MIIQLVLYHNKSYLLNIPSWDESRDAVVCLVSNAYYQYLKWELESGTGESGKWKGENWKMVTVKKVGKLKK